MNVAGIIDMEGLDSFCPNERGLVTLAEFSGDPETISAAKAQTAPMSPLDLRVRYNGQRHPVIFAAEVEVDLYNYLQSHRSIKDCVRLMKEAKGFGIRRSDRLSWSILQRLVPEFEPFTFGTETFKA